MGGFLTFIILIIIFVIGKFVYDSYLTDNTDKNWENYLKENQKQPNKISDLIVNNLSIPQSDVNRDASLRLMALSYNCELSKVEENFIVVIQKELEVISIEEILENLKLRKANDAQTFNMHPNDTPAAIMEEWLTEFYEKDNYDDYETIGSFSDIEKQYVISLLKGEIEKWLCDEARKVIAENPGRDRIMQSMLVMHELESYSENVKLKIIDDKVHYGLTEKEIKLLVHMSMENVVNDLFKDFM